MNDDETSKGPPEADPLELLPRMQALRQSPEWEARAEAARGLGHLGDPSAVDPLCAALSDSNWHVRIAAVGALLRLRDSRAVGPLTSVLTDEDWYIRVATITALQEIGDPEAVPALCLALGDYDAQVRASAAEALGHLGDVRAVQALLRGSKDVNPDVRRSASASLERLGSAETLPLRVLASPSLTAAARVDTLQALADEPPRRGVRRLGKPLEKRLVRYEVGAVWEFCTRMSLKSELDVAIRRNALEALQELDRRKEAQTLLRAGAPMPGDSGALLRAATGSGSTTPAEELLRGGDPPPTTATTENVGLLARLFGHMKRP